MIPENTGTSLNLKNLEAFLSSSFGSSHRVTSATEFAGGASNPTFLLETTNGQFVLRSKPQGKLVSKAHAVDREYRVINALGQTDFPVPKTYFYCNDVDVIGAEFYIMEYVAGRVTEDFTLPNSNGTERAAIYDAMNKTLVHLHSIDPDEIGLSDYGKPGNYFERQINTWMRQYQRQDQKISRFEDLASWLTTNLIRDDQRTIVHGDYRLANIMIAPNSAEVAAVLDWELSTTGHPLADFTYNLSQWYLPNFNKHLGRISLEGADLDALGIPSMDSYAQSYIDRSGADISQKDLNYGIAFNMYRLAGIIIGIIGRAKSGTAKNDFAKSTAHNLEPTIDLAWHYAKKADACRGQ